MAKAKDKHLFARCGCRLCIFAPGQRLIAHSLTMPFSRSGAQRITTISAF